jgi:hypothetical protein
LATAKPAILPIEDRLVSIAGLGQRDNASISWMKSTGTTPSFHLANGSNASQTFTMGGLDLELAFYELANPAVYGLIRSSCRSLCH